MWFFKIYKDNLEYLNTRTSINVFNNLTTATLNFCTGLTIGILNIGKFIFSGQSIDNQNELDAAPASFVV